MSSLVKKPKVKEIKISDLRQGDVFRMRGGQKDLTFEKATEISGGKARWKISCTYGEGKKIEYKRFPFTIVFLIKSYIPQND